MDARKHLLEALAAVYLNGDRETGHRPTVPAGLFESGASRFTVDDERSRVMDTLDRLEPLARAAVVLREFSVLSEDVVSRVLGGPSHDLGTGLEAARQRLREAAGVSAAEPLHNVLARAAVNGPVPGLWPELEEPVRELLARRRRRRRLQVAAAWLTVVLAFAVGMVWLFDFNPFRPDETESRALATVAPAALPATEDEPAPLPITTPTPEPTMPDIPLGNVPDRLVTMIEEIIPVAENVAPEREWRNVMLDPLTGRLHPRELPPGLHYLTPDGAGLLAVQHLYGASGTAPPRMSMTMTALASGSPRWTREFPAFQGWTMSGDFLYGIVWEDRPTLMAFHLTTGKPEAIQTDLARTMGLGANRIYLRALYVTASPDGSRLIIYADFISENRETYTQVMTTYSLPDLNPLETTPRIYDIEPGEQINGVFSTPGDVMSVVTPDGSALYAVGDDAIQFLLVDDLEQVTVDLPFNPPGDSGPIDLRWLTSNDGRYLYVLALSRMEVAVVDLLTRSVDLVAPLDQAVYSLVPETDDAAIPNAVANYGALLSPDGRRLYLLGGWQDAWQPPSHDESAVWVVDVETWRVVNRLAIPGVPAQGTLTRGGEWLIVRSRFPGPVPGTASGAGGFTIFDTASGQVIPETALGELTGMMDSPSSVITFADVYQRTYGRAPAIDGVRPATAETVSALSRLELVPSARFVPSGGTIEFELRVLDPRSGQPLERAKPGVRFEPAGSPMLVLRQRGSGTDLILVPTLDGPGQYRGVVPVEPEGSWDVEVRFDSGGEAVGSVAFPAAFNVTRSLPGESGGTYTIRLHVEQATEDSEERTVRASFVNVETGLVIADGEDLESGLPERLRVTFEHADRRFFTVPLDKVHHGVYEGETRFPGPGGWGASVSFYAESSGAPVATIRLGPVVVGDEEP